MAVDLTKWTLTPIGLDPAFASKDVVVPFDAVQEFFPRPFDGTREFHPDSIKLQEADWKASSTFAVEKDVLNASLTDGSVWLLVFDGLDTVVEVFLNGTSIGKSDNMFVPLRCPLTANMLSTENSIEIIFKSAVKVAKEIEKVYGTRSVWNGDASRVYLRKTQYHWGWDWGPTFVTCGIWKSARLEHFKAKIADVNCIVTLDESHSSATVQVELEVEGSAATLKDSENLSCEVTIHDPAGATVVSATYRNDFNPLTKHVALTHKIEKPELWFPVGAGAQPLYKVSASLIHSSSATPLSTQTQRFGIRTIKLIETPLPKKTPSSPDQESFYFEVNGRPVLIGGSNWIPADSFLPRATREVYEAWLKVLVNGNQNCARVWGGGLYEKDVFYELCDELGVLVWQDFMFACGVYPAHKEFVANVETEARHVVKRLRKHPCIAIFTGNNEDYAFAEQGGFGYEPDNSTDEKQWLSSKFAARFIYERTLPKVVSELWPGTPYKPGSPWTKDGRNSADSNSGDVHQWNVWHGTQEPYQDYGKLAGRFISEFGMQGFPVLETVKAFFEEGTPVSEMDPFGAIVDHHNKATGATKRIGGYVMENLRFGTSLEEFIYATQLMQAEALSAAYRQWRREWGTEGNRRIGGALVWQINDCWPVVSWAIVDYYRRPKPSYYAIKREVAPLSLGISRIVKNAHTKEASVEVWGVNTTDSAAVGTLVIESFDYASGKVVFEKSLANVELPANASTELLGEGGLALPVNQDIYQVVSARFVVAGKVATRATDWPQPLKHLPVHVPARAVKVTQVSKNGNTVTLKATAARPVKGVLLFFRGVELADLDVSDNLVDIVPGDEVEIVVKGWKDGVMVDKVWYNSDVESAADVKDAQPRGIDKSPPRAASLDFSPMDKFRKFFKN
ncbi:hypothetical protein HDU84_003498 [Entophlyctis sp. JEL0112]|nr:hypothetical protein HDU84_003498 [Entophlyctis sp. JEL0112]